MAGRLEQLDRRDVQQARLLLLPLRAVRLGLPAQLLSARGAASAQLRAPARERAERGGRRSLALAHRLHLLRVRLRVGFGFGFGFGFGLGLGFGLFFRSLTLTLTLTLTLALSTCFMSEEASSAMLFFKVSIASCSFSPLRTPVICSPSRA